MAEGVYCIKFREAGKRAWLFLSRDGYGNRLRIHALQFTKENADKALTEAVAANPGFEFWLG